ncbi:MAG: NAD(P)/FAD-dependent oxidoreductase [Steroidobacteraceae bacterium]
MARFDTVIIGAGAAGIAAARRLVGAGRRILLLEARQRVGGRAVVDQSLGVPADLGAAWLHFAEANAWTGLAETLGFHILRRDPGWGPGAHIGARAPSEPEHDAVIAGYDRYRQAVEAAAEAGQDVPLSDVLPEDDFRPRFDAVMNWAVGAETQQVSTLDLTRSAESRHDWAVREGLGAVVAAAAHALPVQLGTMVTAIDWSGNVVRVDSSAGRIEANSVIVTVPTSVLARGAINFHPLLPPRYEEAFANLPLGVANKVYFRIERGLFPDDRSRQFLGTASTSRTCHWMVNVADQPLLMAYFGGSLAQELERRGALVQFAREELVRLFGSDMMRELGASLSTAWGGDLYSLGSYSVARPGFAHSREDLATPVSPQLQFAGEACSVNFYGTLHGAWASGIEAAERLLLPRQR